MFLYPIPRRVTRLSGSVDCSNRRWLLVEPGASFALKDAARRCAAELSGHLAQSVDVAAGNPSAGEVLIRLESAPGFAPDAYHLVSGGDGIRIAASGEPGLYYGLLAAGQLLAAGPRIPVLEIEDAPSLGRRGYMLDVSRCKIPTMANLKSLVDALSRLRYNELELYMEHAFAFAADERVWADASPLTPAEIMELDEYCSSRFIELVPNLNSFGHLERWLRHAEYAGLGENREPWYYEAWDAWYHATLAPDDASLAFIDRLYGEFLPNFTSTRLNIGCDETLELGHGRSRERCEKQGTTRVYLEFLQKLAALAAKHGRSVQFWGDIIMHEPALISELPAGITAMEWGYEAAHPFETDTAKFKAAGIPFYVCPGTSSWNSFAGRTQNMLDNIRSATRHGSVNGAAGMLLTDWGDNGHHQYWPISWPGLVFAAGCAWNAVADHEPLIPGAICYAFPDETGDERLGELLLELGRICDGFEFQPANCNNLVPSLYAPNRRSCVEVRGRMTFAELRAAERRLEKWQRSFETKVPAASRLVKDELRNTADLMRLAIGNVRDLKGGRIDRAGWNDLLYSVTGRHRDLWLARNRAGGLEESAGLLKAMQKK